MGYLNFSAWNEFSDGAVANPTLPDPDDRYFTSFTSALSFANLDLSVGRTLSFKLAARTNDNFRNLLSDSNSDLRLQLEGTNTSNPKIRLFTSPSSPASISLGTNYSHACFNIFEITRTDATTLSVSCNGTTVGMFNVSGTLVFNYINSNNRDYFADIKLANGSTDLFLMPLAEQSGTTTDELIGGGNGTFSSEPAYRARFVLDTSQTKFPLGLFKDTDQGVEIPKVSQALHGYPIVSNLVFCLWLSYGQSLSVGFTSQVNQHLYPYLTDGGYSSAIKRYFMNQDKKGHVHSMIRHASINASNKAFLCGAYGVPSQTVQSLSKNSGTSYYADLIAAATGKFNSLRTGDSIDEIVIDFTQGNANRPNSVDYKETLGQLAQDLRDDLRVVVGNVPFRFIHTQHGTGNQFNDTDSQDIALEHFYFADENYDGINSQLACPIWYILRRYGTDDGVHARPFGYAVKGEYKAYAYNNPSFDGLRPTDTGKVDLANNGTVITIPMDVETLPLRSINESWMPQNNNKGVFLQKENGVLICIQNCTTLPPNLH